MCRDDFNLDTAIIMVGDLEFFNDLRMNENLAEIDNFFLDLDFFECLRGKLPLNLLKFNSIFSDSFNLTVGDVPEIHSIFQRECFVWFVFVYFPSHK